jgi:hypothetical protein
MTTTTISPEQQVANARECARRAMKGLAFHGIGIRLARRIADRVTARRTSRREFVKHWDRYGACLAAVSAVDNYRDTLALHRAGKLAAIEDDGSPF